MKEDVFFLLLLNLSHFSLYLLALPSRPPEECEFTGSAGSQEELGVCATGFGSAVCPAAVPDTGPAHKGDGPKG